MRPYNIIRKALVTSVFLGVFGGSPHITTQILKREIDKRTQQESGYESASAQFPETCCRLYHAMKKLGESRDLVVAPKICCRLYHAAEELKETMNLVVASTERLENDLGISVIAVNDLREAVSGLKAKLNTKN